MTSLTAPERETVILMSDADDTATITTYQRPIVTKLERNPAVTKIEDLDYGSTRGARFEMPAALLSFRSKKATRPDVAARLGGKAVRPHSPARKSSSSLLPTVTSSSGHSLSDG